MENILFLAHTAENGELNKGSLEALGVAVAISEGLAGSDLFVGIVGEDTKQATNQIAICGAKKFFSVSGAEFSQARYATDSVAAEALCKAAEASTIISSHSSRWARSLAGVASRVNGRVDSHISGFQIKGGELSVNRWFYRQRINGEVKRTRKPWFLTVDLGSVTPWDGTSGTATSEEVSVNLGALRTKVDGYSEPKSDQQTIRPDAELLFVTGAGWTKKQSDGETHVPHASELILDFLGKTQASLGSSKSLVDMDSEGHGVLPFLSHLNQIGQTGATPRHPKGLATCCHGEEPHVVGWRFINERRAINKDANCGWAQGKADVLYVADAFEVMEKVNALLG